jgi:ABC-type ATPase with predicted acetyltransferase domain
MLDALREWLTASDSTARRDHEHVQSVDYEHLTTGEEIDATARCDVCGRLFDDIEQCLDHVAAHDRHVTDGIDATAVDQTAERYGPSDEKTL